MERSIDRKVHKVMGSFVLPIILFFAAGCERRSVSVRSDDSPVLVKVNGTPLTKREFDYFLPEDYRDVLTSEERWEYLDRWITTQMLYDEVIRSGTKMSDDVKARLRQYERDLIADQLVQQVIEDRAVVSEDEIHRYYKKHSDRYLKEFRVSHILVSSIEDAEQVKELLDKSSFAYLASRYSIDKHSRFGGDLGYLSKGNMIPEFEDAVFSMKVGDVSDIIESEFGYHIIRLTDVRDARVKLEFEDVKDDIANELTLLKREAVYDSLVTALRARASVEIVNEAIRLVGITHLDSVPAKP